MVLLEGSHTGGALAKAISEILVEYDITDPVSMTADNAANQVRAFQIHTLSAKTTARADEPAPAVTFPNLVVLYCVCHGAELVAGKIAAGAKEKRRAVRRDRVEETNEGAEPNEDENREEDADAEPDGSGAVEEVHFERGMRPPVPPARLQIETPRANKERDIGSALRKAKDIATHLNKSTQAGEYLERAQRLTPGEEHSGKVQQVFITKVYAFLIIYTYL
jgi:hypothetical protein